MKKLYVITILFVFLFSLSACNNSSVNPAEKIKTTQKNSKILVVYFSMPETDKPNNMTAEEANSTVVINGKVLGNTQYIATLIQKDTNGDIFRIESKISYPTDHRTLVDLAKEEQNKSARPELAKKIENLKEYDIIFIGYPNWWGDMPMIMYTFFQEHDFSGKTIIPFNSHGGSGFSNTINTIEKLQPKARVVSDGFTVSRNTVQDCAEDVSTWIKTLNLK